jgi:mRNA-degrading endonuclease HigB of HigAB toxin-antitoxin module
MRIDILAIRHYFSQNRLYAKHILTYAEYDKVSRRYMGGELN